MQINGWGRQIITCSNSALVPTQLMQILPLTSSKYKNWVSGNRVYNFRNDLVLLCSVYSFVAKACQRESSR